MLEEAAKNGAGEFAQKLARAKPEDAGLVVVGRNFHAVDRETERSVKGSEQCEYNNAILIVGSE
jgi:hypothetical protein